MKNAKLSKVRDLVVAIVRKRSVLGATTKEIVEEVCLLHANEIGESVDDLVKIALTRIVNDVSNRKASASFEPGQGNLFANFGVPAQVCVKITGEKDPQRRDTASLTYDELHAWYKDHTKKRAASTKQALEVRRLLKRIRPYSADGITVQAALQAAEAADETKEKLA